MKIRRVATCLTLLLIAGCSSGDGQSGGDHAWKEQVATMDKARDVEKTVMDAAAKQAESVQHQTE